MPFTVACPVCNLDATETANSMITERLAASPTPAFVAPPPIEPPPGALRIHRTEAPVSALPQTALPGAPLLPTSRLVGKSKASGEFNIGLGILGAFLGAGLGAGLMYAFFLWADFRFPLMGTCIGALTGLGARILYKGTDSTLGGISAAIAVLATCGTLFVMFGSVGGMFVISIGVSGYFAYRIAG
jgi:hypothetical protein